MNNPFYVIHEDDVAFQAPRLIGNSKWECADGSTLDYKGEEWAEKEICEAVRRIARIEAVRRAQVTCDHLAVVERAGELCQIMYGQELAEFERSAHHKFVRGLFLLAQHEVQASQKLS